MSPKISVIMSVLNGEDYLAEAVDSVLNQTFTDFEFIMVNDGSTDKTLSIMQSYDDPRIIIINNEKNLGLAAGINKALAMAKGQFVAKMDADDICMPDRLQQQEEYLSQHNEVGVVGAAAYHIDKNGKYIGAFKQYDSVEELEFAVCFEMAFYNPSLMYRRNILSDNNITHNEKFHSSGEDFQFISKVLRFTSPMNLSEPLLCFRKHNQSVSVTKSSDQKENNIQISLLNIARYIDISNKGMPNVRKSLSMMAGKKPKLLQDIIDFVDFLDQLRVGFYGKNPQYCSQIPVKAIIGRKVIKLLLQNKKYLINPVVIVKLLVDGKWCFWSFLLKFSSFFLWRLRHNLKNKFCRYD